MEKNCFAELGKMFPFKSNCKVSVDAKEHIFHGSIFTILRNKRLLIGILSVSFVLRLKPLLQFSPQKLGRKMNVGFCV
jgi:hypothetical protein